MANESTIHSHPRMARSCDRAPAVRAGRAWKRNRAPRARSARRWRPRSAAGGDLNLGDFLSGGRNPILQAATPLLTIASRLQSTVAHADVPALRNQAMQEVRAFDDRLRSAGVAPDDALVARYLLCTFFDSAVLNTPWGAQSDWSGGSLLITFHLLFLIPQTKYGYAQTTTQENGPYIGVDLRGLYSLFLSQKTNPQK